MKKLKLLLVLSAFGLASCGGTTASSSVSQASTSEDPTPTSSETPSTSEESVSSEEPEPVNDHLIEYQDFQTPGGLLLSQEEWNLVAAEAASNQNNLVSKHGTSSEESSDFGIRNPAEAGTRKYEGSFSESSWTYYEGRKAEYVLDSSSETTALGGYSTSSHERELFFIEGNDEDGYGLYFNHWENINGIEGEPYTTVYTTSSTLEESFWDCGPYYDYYIYYAESFGNQVIRTAFSPDVYDEYAEYSAFIKTEDGTIYVTAISEGINVDEYELVNVDGEEKALPHHYIQGTQFVYSKVEGFGYCLTKYTTMSMDYYSLDFYGNRLDEPVVTYKRLGVTEWVYGEKAAYEGSDAVVIEISSVPYTVTLDNYDTSAETPTISSSANFSNVTRLYKGLIDPEFEGYAFQYVNYDYGIFKVGVAGPEGYTALSLGWSDLTTFEDFEGYVYQSEELENGIADDGYGYVSYLVVLNADGSLAEFSVAFLI